MSNRDEIKDLRSLWAEAYSLGYDDGAGGVDPDLRPNPYQKCARCELRAPERDGLCDSCYEIWKAQPGALPIG